MRWDAKHKRELRNRFRLPLDEVKKTKENCETASGAPPIDEIKKQGGFKKTAKRRSIRAFGNWQPRIKLSKTSFSLLAKPDFSFEHLFKQELFKIRILEISNERRQPESLPAAFFVSIPSVSLPEENGRIDFVFILF